MTKRVKVDRQASSREVLGTAFGTRGTRPQFQTGGHSADVASLVSENNEAAYPVSTCKRRLSFAYTQVDIPEPWRRFVPLGEHNVTTASSCFIAFIHSGLALNAVSIA
ncbi:hypothetical protein CFAM422_002156 [Trichoderma lentiforme]|uniref:Uncharacterized protein n=1 Tax=Trichoderma lentiforme TaxID=1567552 RepID=A0A9P4XK09_9HYPO|nr:hypothetical protein CFAM422_002156 [Trichoderma lentiforme]